MTANFHICAMLLASAIAAADAPKNLLRNGDFEQGHQAWQPDEATARLGQFRVEADAKRASRVLRVENKGGDAIVGLWQTVPCRAQKVYELTGFSRSTKLVEGAGVAFHCLDAAGRLVRRAWVHQIPSWGIRGWQPFWAEFRPPKGTQSIQVRLVVYKKGTAWFDGLVLVEKDPAKKTSLKGQQVGDAGLAVQRYATKRPVYSMDVDDLDCDGALDFVLADIDGVLRRQNEAGQVAWERDMGGLVFALDCGDLDGDGTKEIAACTADTKGTLQVLSARGEPLWTHAVPGTIFGHVTIGDLDRDGKAEVLATHDNQLVALSPQGRVLWQQSFGGPRFRAVAVADLNRDGRNEVAVSLNSQKLFAAAFDAQGKPLWRYMPRGRQRLTTEDVHIADVDADGTAEVVVACTAGLAVCIRDGQTVWDAPRERPKLWAKHRDATANFGSEQSHLVVADFCPDRPGLETLVALIDSVWLLDSAGKRIWEGDSGLLIRSMVLGPNREVYIPSSGLRDCSFYKLAFVRGQGNPLAQCAVPNPIYKTLEGLYEQACAMEKLPAPSNAQGKFHVIYANVSWPFSRWGSLERLKRVSDSLRAKESEHLEFVLMLWPKDLPVELHRGGMMEQGEILKVVEFLEKLGRPFMFFADHGCSPNLSLATIEKTLRLAPRTCRGMYVAENTAQYPSPKWDEFVQWAMKVMDLCQQHGGKQMVFKEMFESWAFLPADPRVRATLLHPKYKDTLVAMYATNNPYAPELQIGGMAGLKHAGLVRDWGISTQYWNWSWDAHRTQQNHWAYCPADTILAMELSTVCLGGRWLHIEGGQEYLVRGTGELSERAKRHRDLVYELIRKNVLLPVRDEDNGSFSNVVLVRRPHPLLEQLRAKGSPLGPPYSRPLGPLRSGLMGVNDALQRVTPDYFPAYAYGHKRYTQTMAPQTPYGYVRIVPDDERVRGFLEGKRPIFTDGCDVFIDGHRTSAAEAKAHVLAALEQEAAKLPVRAPGAAVFAHRLGNNYRVFLLDPGYMCPHGVETALSFNPPHASFEARDMLSGRVLPVQDGNAAIAVAPGAFLVVEIVPR